MVGRQLEDSGRADLSAVGTRRWRSGGVTWLVSFKKGHRETAALGLGWIRVHEIITVVDPSSVGRDMG